MYCLQFKFRFFLSYILSGFTCEQILHHIDYMYNILYNEIFPFKNIPENLDLELFWKSKFHMIAHLHEDDLYIHQ